MLIAVWHQGMFLYVTSKNIPQGSVKGVLYRWMMTFQKKKKPLKSSPSHFETHYLLLSSCQSFILLSSLMHISVHTHIHWLNTRQAGDYSLFGLFFPTRLKYQIGRHSSKLCSCFISLIHTTAPWRYNFSHICNEKNWRAERINSPRTYY